MSCFTLESGYELRFMYKDYSMWLHRATILLALAI